MKLRPFPSFIFLTSIILSIITPFGLMGQVRTGAERMEVLLPLIKGKRIALMANQSSVVGANKTHLLDTLLSRGIMVQKVFVPEHGFRGQVDAGKYVLNGRDIQTNTPIISLYGRNKKPTSEMLSDVDAVVFDLQDVGTRFYTYISSMHYLMEALSEEGKPLIICDRPNPNDYIDGPVLEDDCRSFIGMHPIPVLHGLTVGELAKMINGEGWLQSRKTCPLEVVTIEGWRHGQPYELPVRPSPNLTDARSVELYPSLCFFEATVMSVGRGTDTPFKILGYPNKKFGSYSFVPTIKKGADSNPKYKGKRCYGVNLSHTQEDTSRLSFKWFIHFNKIAQDQGIKFIDRNRTFELLAGNKKLSKQIQSGMTEDQIRSTWSQELTAYRKMRSQYLLYP